MSLSWDQILGGFAVFMFGIDIMGDALKAAAGDQLREYINKYTSKPIYALFIGILLTIVMQSSSASTSITIGLVRAGLMNLEQAAGIIMGANIGTTITSFLFSINIDQYSLYFIFIGFMVRLLARRRKGKSIGVCIIGFGMIFTGLSMMGNALAEIKDMPFFTEFAEKMSSNHLLSLLCGTVMTAVVQASSATISVVQKMYQSGALTLTAVLPFVFGANIGTTVTGILAAIGGSTAAKRTAGIHTLFNIIGTTLGMILLRPYAALITFLADAWNLNSMMQISVAHILFNTATTIVFFPFLKQMCRLIEKIIPGHDRAMVNIDTTVLDDKLAENFPAGALQASSTVMNSMFTAVGDNVLLTKEYMLGQETDNELIQQNEAVINDTDKQLTTYLMSISRSDKMSPHDNEQVMIDLDTVKNLERIGDLSINLMEFFDMIQEDRADLSDLAKKDISGMYDHIVRMLKLAHELYEKHDKEKMNQLETLEESLDKRETQARESHFGRLAAGECKSAVAASVYCDILSNLERIGDHCVNIASSYNKYKGEEDHA
jgi:phosphate:Na+ symporter